MTVKLDARKMPISEFRKKKLLFVFNVFFDVNQSGTIEKKDFEIAVERISSLRGWQLGERRHRDTHDILIQVWDGLRQRADANQDGQVSRDEWCQMWDEYAKNPQSALEWQQGYMNFMFDLEDASGDGAIDEDEFSTVCSSYGLSTNECRQAFVKLSTNNTVEVNREQFAKLWQQYFASENPSDAGNFIFGKLSFDD